MKRLPLEERIRNIIRMLGNDVVFIIGVKRGRPVIDQIIRTEMITDGAEDEIGNQLPEPINMKEKENYFG